MKYSMSVINPFMKIKTPPPFVRVLHQLVCFFFFCSNNLSLYIIPYVYYTVIRVELWI